MLLNYRYVDRCYYWISSDGYVTAIKRLEDTHLLNIFKFVCGCSWYHKSTPFINGEVKRRFGKLKVNSTNLLAAGAVNYTADSIGDLSMTDIGRYYLIVADIIGAYIEYPMVQYA